MAAMEAVTAATEEAAEVAADTAEAVEVAVEDTEMAGELVHYTLEFHDFPFDV